MTCNEKQIPKNHKNEYKDLIKQYENFKSLNLSLDMSRGKPSTKQLDLSSDMFKNVDINSFKQTLNDQDARNYSTINNLIEKYRKLKISLKLFLFDFYNPFVF